MGKTASLTEVGNDGNRDRRPELSARLDKRIKNTSVIDASIPRRLGSDQFREDDSIHAVTAS